MYANLTFKTPDDGFHYFFGYYDKSPLSKDYTKLLALKVSFLNRLPSANDIAVVGYFDLKKENQFVELAQTRTFNWQQGCMLQWLGPEHNKKIIFNDLIDGKFKSVILNIEDGSRQTLSMAVYSVFLNGEKALCIDNERHHWCRRGYSYDGVYNKEKNKNIVTDDGIYLLDFKTDTLTQIVKIEQMNKIKPLNTMSDGANYLEHLMINPSGTKFVFLHRWKSFGGIYARLYVSNIDGTDIKLVNDSGRMSHFCWKSENEILGWGGLKNPINILRRYKGFSRYFIKPLMPLYRKIARGDSVQGTTKISRIASGDSYIIFDLRTGKAKRILERSLCKDGHPSICPSNQNVLLTDTYPGTEHQCQLLIAEITADKTYELDRLNSLAQYDNSPLRCDLHPKWSFCGNFICIDTMHDGIRGMFLYKLVTSDF